MQNETDALRHIELELELENVNAASLVKPTLADSEILGRFFKTYNISDGVDVMHVGNGLEEKTMECPR